MVTPLRALIVEDSPDDAELLVRELRRGGYDVSFERVDTPEGLRSALERGGWDILFADYTMPRFRGTAALEMVRSGGYDLPFIFVSGTIGEDVAVATLKAGANDYVLKGNLQRLVPAVARELREAARNRERLRMEEQRRAAEQALRASQERQRLLFEHIADAVLVFDPQGRISFAGASVREVLGVGSDGLTGKSALDLVHSDDAHLAREAFARVTDRTEGLETVEVRMRHGDGSWRSTDLVLRNLLDHPDIGGVVVTCRDLSERKRLEAEVLQAQKLDSVGRLAGGIAHDFNNLLSVILGHADILMMDAGISPEHREDLGGIREAAGRAAALTRQLLAFSRRQVLEMRPLDLNGIIANVAEMLERILGEEIQVHTRLAPDLGIVRADHSQMEQVLLNLAVNARDAMPRGGRLTIETANVELDAAYPEMTPEVTAGPCVELSVSDVGIGMDAETRAKVFEPFFTTKAAGEGTGLGLATVYGIVKQSGGHIWVYSEPGQGTTFKIFLPRVDEEAERVSATHDSGPPPRGTETILVVEDEPAVRDLVCRVLRELGYTVLEAGGAEPALALAADPERKPDLLVTDVVLPGAGGKEIAERAASILPGLPVLFMSGYAVPVLTSRGILQPGVELLHKPFTAAALAHKVRAVLDAP